MTTRESLIAAVLIGASPIMYDTIKNTATENPVRVEKSVSLELKEQNKDSADKTEAESVLLEETKATKS